MPKKKPKPEPSRPTTSEPTPLPDWRTRDLLRSIRRDLAEKAKRTELAESESPPKPPRPA